MPVLNYTTSIAVTKTVGEMQTMLGKAGAARIAVDYVDGCPSALSFMLATPHGQRHFTLPVNIDAMHRLLRQEVKGRLAEREQAERVAWRILKDWLAAQLALVATEMVGMDQVMLPYLQVEANGRTLYDTYRDRENVLMLESAQ